MRLLTIPKDKYDEYRLNLIFDCYKWDPQFQDNNTVARHVLVITKDYQIKGKVFMPKTGRKNRVLSDILNGSKRFVAIKDCEVIHREFPNRKAESHDFLQLNLNSIILLRPLNDE